MWWWLWWRRQRRWRRTRRRKRRRRKRERDGGGRQSSDLADRFRGVNRGDGALQLGEEHARRAGGTTVAFIAVTAVGVISCDWARDPEGKREEEKMERRRRKRGRVEVLFIQE